MSEKITPGLWEMTANGVVRANGEIVAMVYGADPEQMEANTKAVAQLPRMLQALRTAADILPDNDFLEEVYAILEETS